MKERSSSVDLRVLDAPTLAGQYACPEGDVGRALGRYMSTLNRPLYKEAICKLDPEAHGRVLEIGFGDGGLIHMLAGPPLSLSYVGIDVSHTMVDEATARNCGLVNAGRASFHVGNVTAIPWSNAFDYALAINSIYFWLSALEGLRQIRRALRSGGVLVLATMTPQNAAQSPIAKYGFTVLDERELGLLHAEAGFDDFRASTFEETAKRIDGTPYARSNYLTRATAGKP